MKYQYLGTTANLLSAYRGGFLRVYILDARHGEIRDSVGETRPLTNYAVFSEYSGTLPPELFRDLQQFKDKLVVDNSDIVWLIVDDSMVERPYMYFPGKRIKENYDGTVYHPQVTMKTTDALNSDCQYLPASYHELKRRGLM